MKRKVIQIANSTQLISLPRQWAKKHDIKRGDELDITEDGARIVVQAGESNPTENAEIDISELGVMTPRFIHAMYKKGVDELHVAFDDHEKLKTVHTAIGKESVGYEILEQSQNHCTIKYVSGSLEEFDSVLRRTFLVLLTMAEQANEQLKAGKFSQLKNTSFLEESNNRFTTIMRRYLNKNGQTAYSKVGPLYYIIEELERVADQYKYMCQHFANMENKDVQLHPKALELFEQTVTMVRLYYELFYKFDLEKLDQLKIHRKNIIDGTHEILADDTKAHDYWLAHHSAVIANKLFGMSGPLMINAV